jgi:hypothetical protein
LRTWSTDFRGAKCEVGRAGRNRIKPPSGGISACPPARTMAGVNKTLQRVPAQLLGPGRCVCARLYDLGTCMGGESSLRKRAKYSDGPAAALVGGEKRRWIDRRRILFGLLPFVQGIVEPTPSERALPLDKRPFGPAASPVSCVAGFQDSASVAERCDASARLHAHRAPLRH